MYPERVTGVLMTLQEQEIWENWEVGYAKVVFTIENCVNVLHLVNIKLQRNCEAKLKWNGRKFKSYQTILKLPRKTKSSFTSWFLVGSTWPPYWYTDLYNLNKSLIKNKKGNLNVCYLRNKTKSVNHVTLLAEFLKYILTITKWNL